jgi:phospholipid/cholesterol/gamma-HCH transport system substrate-binding protein
VSGINARFAGLSKVLTTFVVLALIAALFLVFTSSNGAKTVTADFKTANSLYKGGEVRIAGVVVGEIKSVEAKGDHVEVTMEYDGDVKIPADAKAVEISPAIVGDRFIQFGPAYTGGPVLPDNAKIGIERTAVPIELDDIFKSVDDLALALGPEGANKNGSLSRLIESTANQLDGQGEQLAETLTNFSKLSTTLSNNQEDLFSSIDEVEKFVRLLRQNDAAVRDFFDSTAEVSEVLADEREELADTIEALSVALLEVRDFVRENRSTLRGNVDNLESVAAVLASRSEDIDHLLTDAPVAFGLLGAIGGGSTGTADARGDLAEIVQSYGINTNPAALLGLLNLLGLPLPTVGSASAAAAGTDAAAAGSSPSAETPAPELVPGLDSVVDNLGGMLAVN